MSFLSPNLGTDKAFNNADSFAMAFDEAWRQATLEGILKDQSQEDKLEIVLSNIEEHPFFQKSPSEAKLVAKFRIKLLKLN